MPPVLSAPKTPIQIPSLREYLLLSQDRIEAELHRREGETWKTLRFTEGTVPLACLDLEIPLATVYEDVPTPETPTDR